MATLEVICENQKLKWAKNPEEIHSGNVNIDSIKFQFCQLWDGFTKTAVFYRENEKENAVLIAFDDTYTCKIPPEVSQTNGIVYVGAFGVDATGSKRATEPICFYLKEGIITEGTPSDPTPDIYTQILSVCNETYKIANAVRTEAENGAFNGKDGYTPVKGVDYFDGAKGDTGEKGADGYTPVRGKDYWTEEDKAEIKAYVEEAILGGEW